MKLNGWLVKGPLKVKKKWTGFTLIELMIAITLGVFLIGAVVLTFITGRTAAGDAEQLSRMQENVRIVSEYLVRDIRNAGYTDEGSLTVSREGLIRRGFAEIDPDDPLLPLSGSSLKVRYAGRGHCGQRFEEIVVVENEYRLDGDVLVCEGRNIPPPPEFPSVDGIQETDDWDDVLENAVAVPIIAGVSGLQFQAIPPNGATACNFWTLDAGGQNLENTCLGIRIRLELAGPRNVNRPIELTAAFRNAIIDRVNARVPAPP